MDTQQTIQTPPPAAAGTSANPGAFPQGGAVEPADRARVAIRTFQTPEEAPAERYELRDPFADTTYRSTRLADIVAKANQLGASRFLAVDPQGQRSFFRKQGEHWEREPAAQPTRHAASPSQEQTSTPDQTQTAPEPVQTPTAEVHTSAMPDATSLARMDAEAERAAQVARIEAALGERYIIKRLPLAVGELGLGLTEYRFRGDTSRIAFTETTFRLTTDTNSPSVARSMVDVAEARHWDALRVSGHDDFRRLVWLEAAVRGVKALGYEPTPADLERLQAEREQRQVNRIEPLRESSAAQRQASATHQQASATTATSPPDKASGRGSGGRKAVLVAIEAVLVANRVPEERRAAIMAAAAEKLAQRTRDGLTTRVKVYDPAAPSQRARVVPNPEQQRTRERNGPAPAR